MRAINLRAGAVIALVILTLVCSTRLFNQNEELTALRQRNQEQANRIEQLTAEVLGFSNRMAHTTLTKAPPSDGLREILRLRSEIGVLRDQLQDVQRLMEKDESARSNGLSGEIVQRLQVRAQKARERLKTLRNRCYENGADRDMVLQEAYKHDGEMVLRSMERSIARKALSDPGLDPAQTERIKASIEDLDIKIKQRAERMLLDLDDLIGAFNQVLDGVPAGGDDRIRAIASLHDLVNRAGLVLGSPP
jgi:hypothetical protein